MRLLFTIPHFFQRHTEAAGSAKHGSRTADPQIRFDSLCKTIYSLHQTFGSSQAMIRHADRRTTPANTALRADIHVIVVTCGDKHLIKPDDFAPPLCLHMPVEEEPTHLGFACQRIMRDRWGNYDFYCYLEDDLSLNDAFFFQKLRWFDSYIGQESLLLPNRYERSINNAYDKCYVDGDLAEQVTKPFHDRSVRPELSSTVMGTPLRFVRPLNPHSGCYFLSALQMGLWMRREDFGKSSSDFIGPLESAATLGIMKTFRIYKPAVENASFLEIEHAGDQYIRKIYK